MIPRLAQLLGQTLKGAGLEATSAIWQIAERWPDIVGPRIATRAAPVRLRGDELVLAAPDAVWRQELTLLGPDIVERVNHSIGKPLVRRVRLISGDARAPTSPRHRRRKLHIRHSSAAGGPVPNQPSGAPSTPSPTGVAAALEALEVAREQRIEADRTAPRRQRTRRRP